MSNFFNKSIACLLSASFPALIRNSTGFPRPSTIAWSFVFNPPRVLPMDFSAPFKATVCALVCFCHCRIYAQIFHICITGKRMKNFFPYTIFLPFSESCIDTLPWSIAFWHFSPLSSRSCNPQHSIQHDAVIFCRSSSFACSLCWQLVFDSFPFAIADFISFHSSILSFFGSLCKFYFSNKA